MKINKLLRIIKFLVLPIFQKIESKVYEKLLPNLDEGFSHLTLSGHALQKLIRDYNFETVIDIGSGACAPLSIRASKDVVCKSLDSASLQEAMEGKYDSVKAMVSSEDFIEGPKAFAEKRAPNWQGK
jgi:enoyl-CoA hydratase/carnithine racemase